MAPSIKNSKNNGLINPYNWNTRVPATTDAAADFYQRYNASFHGFLYQNNVYYDGNGVKQAISGNAYTGPILVVGTYNEIALQPTGAGQTITVLGSLIYDQQLTDFVNANTVTGADGIIRVASMYRYIQISSTGVGATNGLYIQIW